MKILGLDISAYSATLACVDQDIPNLREYFYLHQQEIKSLVPSANTKQYIATLGIDYACMEPTGVNYASWWASLMKHLGVPILWVGHIELASFRRDNRLPGKNDRADALALAVYGYRRHNQPAYFVRWNPDTTAGQLRQYCLQLKHLARCANPIINRLRQNLTHEVPEVATASLDLVNGKIPVLLKVIAGQSNGGGWETRRQKQIANSCGSGLSEFSRHHAGRLLDLYRQELEIEKAMNTLTNTAEFAKYLEVFDQFGFGRRVRCLILSTIYPIETFLKNGDRHIEYVRTKNGKKSKRDRSLASFKLALGIGLVEKQSGDVQVWVPGGSNLCRVALWQWCFTRIDVKRNRPKSEVGQFLGEVRDRYHNLNPNHARSKVIRYAVEMLFEFLIAVV